MIRYFILLVLADIISSDYGSKKKCSTHYETVHAVVYDTVYKKKCSEGSDEKCKIVHIHSYKGEVETQCYPDYEPKCKTDYKTGYKQFCSTIEDTECYFVSKSFYKTIYSKKCSTSYKKSCHDVGYGYHKEKKCTSHPVHKCHDVPKKIHSSKPVKKCNKKPKEKCHSVPKTVPIKKCYHVPKQHCESVPVKNPVTIPKKQCWDVKAKHCHTVPVKKPRTVVKKVPKVACVEKGHEYHDHHDHHGYDDHGHGHDDHGYGHEDHGHGYDDHGHDHGYGGHHGHDDHYEDHKHPVGGYKDHGGGYSHHRRNDQDKQRKYVPVYHENSDTSKSEKMSKSFQGFEKGNNFQLQSKYDDWFENRADKTTSVDYQKHTDLVQTTAYKEDGFRGSFENIDYERKALNMNEELLSQYSNENIEDSYDYVSASYLEDMY